MSCPAEIDEALLTEEEQLPTFRQLLPLGRTGEEIRRRVSSLKPISEREEENGGEELQSLRARLRSM